jgi:hypothetical protein
MPHNTRPLASPAQPKLMESYFFSYTYANPSVINGVTTKQSFIGSGFAPVGIYKQDKRLLFSMKPLGYKKQAFIRLIE